MTVLSRLYRRLQDFPDGDWTLEELARDLRTSKTQTAKALRELEEKGLVALTVEES